MSPGMYVPMWIARRIRSTTSSYAGESSTFSTFAVESVDLVDAGRTWLAFRYVVASLAAGLGAYILAGESTRRVRARFGPEAAPSALALPLEEEP